ncbi:MAG: hypothetical protein ACRDMV_02265 [Streptosporangiales bacterium]
MPGDSALADAVAAIGAAKTAMVARWPQMVTAVSGWELASAVTTGRLLSPTTAIESSNTSRLFRPGR